MTDVPPPVADTHVDAQARSARRKRAVLPIVVAAAVMAVVAAIGAGAGWRLGGLGGDPGGDGQTPQGGFGEVTCGFADEFDGDGLDTAWERLQLESGFAVKDRGVEITAPDGADIYNTQTSAPMLLQAHTGDFVLETEVAADPKQFYQGAGLVLWNTEQSYVRLERGFGTIGAIVFEYKDGGQHIKVHPPESSPKAIRTDATRVVLQLTKTPETVTARWRAAGAAQWQDLGTINIKLPTRAKGGIAVLNRAQNGAQPATFNARFEYVRATCA